VDWSGASANVPIAKKGNQCFEDEDVLCVATTYYHVIACTKAGAAYAWGYNGYGQCGTGDKADVKVPRMISGMIGKRVIHVASGYDCVAMLTDDNELYAMGNNSYGQLGCEGTNPDYGSPQLVVLPVGRRISWISAGGYHFFANVDREMYCWGQNHYGQLGLGKDSQHGTQVKIPILHDKLNSMGENWASGSNGLYHSILLTADGKVFTAGDGYSSSYPCCGHGSYMRLDEFKQIESLNGINVVQVVGSHYHSGVLTSEGHVYTWGYGSSNRLGLGDSATKLSPTRVTGAIDSERVAFLALGSDFGVVITEKGDIFCFGSSGFQNMQNTSVTLATPTAPKPDAMGGMSSVYFVSCGMKTNFFISGPPRSTPKKPLSLPYGGMGSSSAGDLPPYPSSAYLVGDASSFCKDYRSDKGKSSTAVLKDLVLHSRDVLISPEEAIFSRIARIDSEENCVVLGDESMLELKVQRWSNFNAEEVKLLGLNACGETQVRACATNRSNAGLLARGANTVTISLRKRQQKSKEETLAEKKAAEAKRADEVAKMAARAERDLLAQAAARELELVSEEEEYSGSESDYSDDDGSFNYRISSAEASVGPVAVATSAESAAPTEADVVKLLEKAVETQVNAVDPTPKNLLISFAADDGTFSYQLLGSDDLCNFSLRLNAHTEYSVEFRSSVFEDCKDDEPGWHNLLVVFGGQHRLAELSADSKPQTTKSFATIAVFFDNQILASLELPAFLCLLPPDRSAPEFLQGSATMTFTKNFCVPSTSLFVKDVAYWRYALNSKHVECAVLSGPSFVAQDWAESVSHNSKVYSMDFSRMESLALPASIELRGEGKFEQALDQQWLWPTFGSQTASASAASNVNVLSLAANASLKMPRGLASAKKKDQYTLIIDLCIDSLPAYPGRQAIFKASADSSGSADLYVRHDGYVGLLTFWGDGGTGEDASGSGALGLSLTGASAAVSASPGPVKSAPVGANVKAAAASTNIKPGARIRPQKWHRLCIVVDCKKQILDVFLDGAIAVHAEKHEKLKEGDRYSLDSEYLLFSDANDKFMLPVKVRQVQVRFGCLDSKQVQRLGSPEMAELDDGRTASKFTTSLLKMGFPLNWCLQALDECAKDREASSRWMLLHRAQLSANDHAVRRMRVAENLSLMGYPVSWCIHALSLAEAKAATSAETEVPEDLDSDAFSQKKLGAEVQAVAIQWLLDNHKELAIQQASKSKEDLLREKFDQEKIAASRRLATKDEKGSSDQGGYRLLNSTSEPLEIALDSLIRREVPARVTSFPKLEEVEDLERLSSLAQVTEDCLAIAYGRECVLSMLKHWPTQITGASKETTEVAAAATAFVQSASNEIAPAPALGSIKCWDQALCGLDQVSRFLRLCDFARVTDALDIMRVGVFRQLKSEAKLVRQTAKVGSNFDMVQFSKLAPLSRYLLDTALLHMVHICSNPQQDVNDAVSENEAIMRWNVNLIVWIFDCFIEVVGKFSGKPSSCAYGSKVLCAQVVNLVFKGVAMLSGANRLLFVRLLSTLIKLDVQFDSEISYSLKDLLNRTHDLQSSSGSYSPFFQALLELMINVERVELARLGTSTQLITTGSVAAVIDDAKEEKDEEKHSSEGKDDDDDVTPGVLYVSVNQRRKGVLSLLGSANGLAAWKNPALNGLVNIYGSGSDQGKETALAEFVNPDPIPVGACVYPSVATSSVATENIVDGKRSIDVDPAGFGTGLPVGSLWIGIDFLQYAVNPSHYILSQPEEDPQRAARSWNLEGRVTGSLNSPWVMLHSAKSDTNLTVRGSYNCWSSVSSNQFYNQFRILFTGADSGGKRGFATLAGFELFGRLRKPQLIPFCWNAQESSSGLLFAFDTEVRTKVTEDKKSTAVAATIESPEYDFKEGSNSDAARCGVIVLRSPTKASKDGWMALSSQTIDVRIPAPRPGSVIDPGSTSHYFEIRLDQLGPSASNIALTTKDKGRVVGMGLVPATFIVDPASATGVSGCAVLGDQGSWGFISSGHKTQEKQGKTIHIDYGASWESNDVIGMEFDIARGSLQFFKNDVPQGFAYTNLELDSAFYRVAVFIGPGAPDTVVTLLGEKERPSSKRPANAAWLQGVLNLHSALKSFAGRKRPLSIEWARQVQKMIGNSGIGSSERSKKPGPGPAAAAAATSPDDDLPPDVQNLTLKREPSQSDWRKQQPKKNDSDDEFDIAQLETLLAVPDQDASIGPIPVDLEEFYETCDKFSFIADEQLVSLVDRICEKSGKEVMQMPGNQLLPDKRQLMHYSQLEMSTTRDLQARFVTLQHLNDQLTSVLPMIDFSVKGNVSALASQIRGIRGLIFWGSKSKVWQAALDATVTKQSAPTSVPIDRFKAGRLRDRGKVDWRGTKSCFGQMFRVLNKAPVMLFRQDRNKRAFNIKFRGEGGIDAGGLYREAIHDMCKDLQSPQMPLFILCPNGRDAIGNNRDKWVPKPNATKPLHLAMFEFLGKMMGLAIRSRELLNLDFPSIIWKGLIGDEITEQDVLDIDRLSFKIIDDMHTLINVKKVSREDFNSMMADTTFVMVGSDGKEYELVKNGRQKTLTFDNYHEFCRAVVEYRLNEFTPQVQAMRRGLATVVPAALLSLFTWEELEIQVCGRPQMNVDLLQKMTKYEGTHRADALHIKNFWEIMRLRFDEMERAKFLKFIWGRSRLPVRSTDFETHFKITPLPRSTANPDGYMPIAHTCFFSLELPAYTTIDVMHKRMIYAANHCEAIDADHVNVESGAVEESDEEDEAGDAEFRI